MTADVRAAQQVLLFASDPSDEDERAWFVGMLCRAYNLPALVAARSRLYRALPRQPDDPALNLGIALLSRAIRQSEAAEEPEPLPDGWEPPTLRVVK